MKKIITFFPLLIAFAGSVYAGGGVGPTGAIEATQLLNYGELYNQTNTVMSQLQTQMAQLANLQKQVARGATIHDFASNKKLFMDVIGTVRQAQGIGYDSQVMAARFSSLYPDFNQKTGTDFFTQYGSWSKDLNGMLKAAMGTSNLHVQNFASDAATADTLQRKVSEANTHESQVDVINAGNEVAYGTYREMQQMRQMQVVQNAAQISFMAKQNSETDKKEADAKDVNEMHRYGPECNRLDTNHVLITKGGCTKKQWADWHAAQPN